VKAALVAVALVAAVWGVLHIGWYGHSQIVDYGVYQQYGDEVVKNHSVPYRDFQLEYPPGALPVFIAPALLERFDYRTVFQLLMAACLVGAVLASFAIAGPWAAVLTAVAPLALGSVVLSRFDLWPAALTVLALAAALRRYWAVSAVVIGTAFAAKLWPAVLIPLVAIWIARSDGGRAAGRWLGIAAGTAAAWFLPFVLLSPGGVAHSFHAQFARPLQLESLGASLLITWHHVIGTPLYVESSYGSQNLIGAGTHAMAIVTSVVGVLALAAIYVAFARGTSEVGDLLRYAVAAVAVTLAFGKVFSPQFLIWLIPLVPLVRGRRGFWATSLFFTALVLTQLWFPERYWQLANHFALAQSRELLARNVAVLALTVVLVRPWLQHDVLGEHRTRVEALERVRAQVE
jgi:uncharacterized membrane protein